MTDAAFIATGWIGTAMSIALYTASVRWRIRRATGAIDAGRGYQS